MKYRFRSVFFSMYRKLCLIQAIGLGINSSPSLCEDRKDISKKDISFEA